MFRRGPTIEGAELLYIPCRDGFGNRFNIGFGRDANIGFDSPDLRIKSV